MASRGRGRGGRGGTSMSISTEQLGFGKGEALPPPVLQPPSKYPLLDYKPIPFELNTELSYLIELKRDFAEHLRESPFNVQSVVIKKDIERYSDRYQDMVSDKVAYEDRYNWLQMPAELKSNIHKRRAAKIKDPKVLPAKKKKEVDVDKKLQELEQKENTQPSDVEEDEKGEEDVEDKDPDHVIEEEEEEPDEEMDDGTDYVNNYFDNGEGYDDEDDNLDDGPIY